MLGGRGRRTHGGLVDPELAVRKDSDHLELGGLQGPQQALDDLPGTESNIHSTKESTHGLGDPKVPRES